MKQKFSPVLALIGVLLAADAFAAEDWPGIVSHNVTVRLTGVRGIRKDAVQSGRPVRHGGPGEAGVRRGVSAESTGRPRGRDHECHRARGNVMKQPKLSR